MCVINLNKTRNKHFYIKSLSPQKKSIYKQSQTHTHTLHSRLSSISYYKRKTKKISKNKTQKKTPYTKEIFDWSALKSALNILSSYLIKKKSRNRKTKKKQ